MACFKRMKGGCGGKKRQPRSIDRWVRSWERRSDPWGTVELGIREKTTLGVGGTTAKDGMGGKGKTLGVQDKNGPRWRKKKKKKKRS